MDSLRVISLIASATEIVDSLGWCEALVGRSHECDFPRIVEHLPVCSESRVDPTAPSREIDRQVKAAVAQALSVYRVKVDELQRLRPTHVITQTQCEVCAVSLQDVERALCELVDSRPQIVVLEPMSLTDVWRDICTVATALGDAPRGERLVAALQSRLTSVAESVRGITERPSVVCLEWIDPLMSAGNWMPELVEIAGGRPLLARPGQHSPWMTWDDLTAADPDVIVILPCGFDMRRTIAELPPLVQDARWRRLRAVRQGRVFVTDGNQYFNRPGPRLIESAEILADVLHRPATARRHHRTGWLALHEIACL